MVTCERKFAFLTQTYILLVFKCHKPSNEGLKSSRSFLLNNYVYTHIYECQFWIMQWPHISTAQTVLARIPLCSLVILTAKWQLQRTEDILFCFSVILITGILVSFLQIKLPRYHDIKSSMGRRKSGILSFKYTYYFVEKFATSSFHIKWKSPQCSWNLLSNIIKIGQNESCCEKKKARHHMFLAMLHCLQSLVV